MDYIQRILNQIATRDPDQLEFQQATKEALASLQKAIDANPNYEKQGILERLSEPERVIVFRVSWVDDNNQVRVNRGYRVQYCSVLGPYKGGLRFHPSTNLSTMKFLAFEQTLKNALTGLPLGGGKGGSDFDPKGKSEGEIMRFCQAFMLELYRHIGKDVDVPAGDMGVGAREIGYLFGMYRKIKGGFEGGVLTGKGIGYGGSLVRKEATGYGLLYFVSAMLTANGLSLAGKRILISGSGNVAMYAAEKATELGGIVVAMSDSSGFVYETQGLDLALIKQIKEERRERIANYIQHRSAAIYQDGSIYDADFPVDIALPCATQNEIDALRADALIRRGVMLVAEGANMPSSNEAIAIFLSHDILFAPAKAANAGGVATSGLEMTQNGIRLSWTFAEVDERLHAIMNQIHASCREAAVRYGYDGNQYVAGANIAGFERVVNAMLAQGID